MLTQCGIQLLYQIMLHALVMTAATYGVFLEEFSQVVVVHIKSFVPSLLYFVAITCKHTSHNISQVYLYIHNNNNNNNNTFV